ncbi:MAG: DegT/DnrJ/EryC1/StrS family aminotransferase, partial [Halanaerobiales bacterium]
ERDRFIAYLQEKGIGYGIHYPLPVYRQPIYEKLGYGGVSLPVTEELSEKVVSLPVHPALSREDLETIVQVIRDYSPGR